MRPTKYLCLFLVLLLISGCDWRRGRVTVNKTIVDTLERQYGIYQDLEKNKNAQSSACTVPFSNPDLDNISVGGSAGAAPNRQQDEASWREQVSRQSGTNGTFTDPPPTATNTAPSTSSPTDRLFNDGGGAGAGASSDNISGGFLSGGDPDPVPFGNNAFSSDGEVDNLNVDNPPTTFGSEENTVFTLTIRDIFPVNFSNIQLSHLSSNSATVQTFGIAQLTMKDVRTNRLSAQPYDSVDVSIRFFLEEEPNGVWICKHRTVDITTTPLNRGRNSNLRGGLPAGNTIVRW